MIRYLLACALICGSVSAAWAQDGVIKVVATQTIFADLVKRVGKERVEVSAIASPKYNIHFIQPKPSDVRRVARADLYVNGGLDLEAWSDPLLEAAGKPRLFRNAEGNVDLSQGVPLLGVPDHPLSRAEGDIHAFGNPHFHMNPDNARIMVRTIVEKLKSLDPGHAAYFEANAGEFLLELDSKIKQWKRMCLPLVGREIISYHEDTAYFADFLGVKAEQFMEPKPGIPPSPKHVQFLEHYAAANHITAIVAATYYPHDAANTLAARIGGKVVTLCQGVGEVPGTDDFFSFFDYNFKQIAEGVH